MLHKYSPRINPPLKIISLVHLKCIQVRRNRTPEIKFENNSKIIHLVFVKDLGLLITDSNWMQ